MIKNFHQRKKARVKFLKGVAYSPQSIDFDKARASFAGYVPYNGRQQKMNIKGARRISRRHELVEELAFLAQHIRRIEKNLDDWECELLAMENIIPPEGMIEWVKTTLNWEWDKNMLAREIRRIHRKIQPKEQKIAPVDVMKNIKKENISDILNKLVSDVLDKYTPTLVLSKDW